MAISDATKLRIYNGALRNIGDRSLASLTEEREARRVLDAAWGNDDDIVKWALERGEWNFALRSIELANNPSVSPAFGYAYVFDKPDDLKRLAGLYADEYMRHPLVDWQFKDEGRNWLTDYATIYVRYVSDGFDYGRDDSQWPEVFKEFMELRLALEVCERLTNSKGLGDRLEYKMKNALADAKSHDAMQEGVKFFPTGSWVGARSFRRYDK